MVRSLKYISLITLTLIVLNGYGSSSDPSITLERPETPNEEEQVDQGKDEAFVEKEVVHLAMEPGVPVNSLLFAVNEDWLNGQHHPNDPAIHDIFSTLRLNGFRFPGGTPSSFWDWKAGGYVDESILTQSIWPEPWRKRHVVFRANLQRFAEPPCTLQTAYNLARQTGAEPIWMVNTITQSLESNKEMIEQLAKMGAPLRAIELGNEVYFGFFRRTTGSGDQYLTTWEPLIDLLREKFPDAQLGVPFSHSGFFEKVGEEKIGDEYQSEGHRWNDELLKRRDLFDAYVLHSYLGSHLLLRDYPEAQWGNVLLAQPIVAMRNAADRSRTELNSAPLWMTEFSLAYQKLRRERYIRGEPVEGWMTSIQNTTLHALHVASYFIGAVRDHDVWKMNCYHSLMGPDFFALARKEQGEVQINVVAQVVGNLSQIAQEHETMHSVQLSETPVLPDLEILGSAEVPALACVAFQKPGQTTWVILNASSQEKTVAWEGEQARLSRYTFQRSEGETAQWCSLEEYEQAPLEQPVAAIQESIKVDHGLRKITLPGESISFIKEKSVE